MNNHCRTALVRLWILRILLNGGVFSRFVRGSDFLDDDVACFLNLTDWMERGFKREDWKTIRMELEDQHRLLESRENHEPTVVAPPNFRALAKVIGLTETQSAVLYFIAVLQDEPVLVDALDMLGYIDRISFSKVIACALKLSDKSVRTALEPLGTLMRSGFLKWETRASRGVRLEFSLRGVGQHLLHEQYSLDAVVRQVVKPAQPATLRPQDYPHIRETLADMRAHLQSVLRDKRRGVNIFIYGPPGTGKTELARVLARSLRCRAFEVSFEDCEGDPLGSTRRMEALRIAGVLLRKRRALLVFDEAEDIFRRSGVFDFSPADNCKAWVNRTLETNNIPTVWISNEVKSLDPAFVRRFDFVFELPAPPVTHRLKIYRRICRSASAPVIRRLASCDAISPAVLSRADAVAQSARADCSAPEKEQAMLRILGDTLRAQGHDASMLASTDEHTGAFEPNFLNSDLPIADFDKLLRGDVSCRICLHGPPGTGKTSFGRWMADRMGRRLHTRTGSDVLRPHLGETEERIAQLFLEARRDNAILMIDEVDSLLGDRGRAVRSWEVSQVNELLTQLERFPGLFIASTNRIEAIDQAALRRFDLKLKLDYLTGIQTVDLLERRCRSLRLEPLSDHVRQFAAALNNATPGDFAVASRQHRFRPFENAMRR